MWRRVPLGPGRTWHLAQTPSKISLPRSALRLLLRRVSAASQRVELGSAASTSTVRVICACWIPQSSAHLPVEDAGLRRPGTRCVRPARGSRRILPPSCGHPPAVDDVAVGRGDLQSTTRSTGTRSGRSTTRRSGRRNASRTAGRRPDLDGPLARRAPGSLSIPGSLKKVKAAIASTIRTGIAVQMSSRRVLPRICGPSTSRERPPLRNLIANSDQRHRHDEEDQAREDADEHVEVADVLRVRS